LVKIIRRADRGHEVAQGRGTQRSFRLFQFSRPIGHKPSGGRAYSAPTEPQNSFRYPVAVYWSWCGKGRSRAMRSDTAGADNGAFAYVKWRSRWQATKLLE